MPRATILIVLILAAIPAAAQDEVGFYFDPEGTATTTTTSAPGEWVQGWLILKNASHVDGIGSWRTRVEIQNADGTPAAVQWQYTGGAQNFDTPPLFDVGTFTLMPWSPAVVLATVLITVPDPAQEIRIFMSGHRFPVNEDPHAYPIYQPEYGHGTDYTPATMSQVTWHGYHTVASINGGGAQSPLPAVTGSFSLPDVAVVGHPVEGYLVYIIRDLEQPLEGLVEPLEMDLEHQRVIDSNPGPSLWPLPWTSGPIWTRFPALSYTRDRYDVRYTPDRVGPLTLGYRLRFGDEVIERFQEVEVIATPCYETGFTYGFYGGDMEDGVLTFHSAVEGNPDPTGYLYVRNIGEQEFLVAPQIVGSSAFSIVNPEPVTLTPTGWPDDVHKFNLVFAPTTPGQHEAEMTFADGTCATVTLRGYSVGVSGTGDLPAATRLLPAHPNPFNPATTVSFELAAAGRARLAVYALDGRLVKVLADEVFAAGPAQRTWSGRDTAGRTVASGVYVVRLETGDVREAQRITLLK